MPTKASYGSAGIARRAGLHPTPPAPDPTPARTELKLPDGEPIVVSKPVATPGDAAAVALTTLDQIGAKAKVQVWLAAQFEAMCTVEAEPFGDEADAPVRVCFGPGGAPAAVAIPSAPR